MSKSCNCGHCPAFRRECEGCLQPCRYSECDGQCAACPVRCGRRDDLEGWLDSIGGLALDAPLQPQPRFRLTGFFPQLLNGLQIPAALQWAPDVAVGIAKILTSRGKVSRRALPHEFGPYNLRAQWGLSELTRLICVGNYKDDYLEGLWTAQLQAEHWTDDIWLPIRVLGFDFCTSLNFSIYLDDPRMEHLVSVKRTWLTVQRMQNTTLIPIPHLQWATVLDLQRQLHYTLEQGFHTLALNLQMTKRQGWDTVVMGIPIIREQAPGFHFLFTGVAGLKRMAQIVQVFPTASFTSTTPHYLAQRYTRLDRDGTRLIKEPVEGHPDLVLAENTRLFQEFLAGLNGHGRTPVRTITPEEDRLRAAVAEVTKELQTRFGLPPELAIETFDRLATDEAILDAFQTWLRTHRLDREFRGSFPSWLVDTATLRPTMEPYPIMGRCPSLGELLDSGLTPLEAFLHLAELAHKADEEIAVLAGKAGY